MHQAKCGKVSEWLLGQLKSSQHAPSTQMTTWGGGGGREREREEREERGERGGGHFTYILTGCSTETVGLEAISAAIF